MGTSWSEKNKTQLAKGDIGEAIVDEHLNKLGFSVYKPQRTDKAHPFDRIAVKTEKGKQDYRIVETKTKARRGAYPDTGFNYSQYQTYLGALKEMPVWVFWVDELMAKIYGNRLDILSEPRWVPHKGKTLKYPIISGGIIYFPLVAMITIAELTPSQVAAVKAYTKSNFRYGS